MVFDERYFRLGLYAPHDCRITPNVGWAFFLCVRDVLLVMFSNLYNTGAARGLHARVYARVRRFLFFAFTPSPVCHKLLSERKKRVKAFVLLPSPAIHPFGRHGEGSTRPKSSPENGWNRVRCGWAVKGEGKKSKFGECVRARERGESFTVVFTRGERKRGRFSI